MTWPWWWWWPDLRRLPQRNLCEKLIPNPWDLHRGKECGETGEVNMAHLPSTVHMSSLFSAPRLPGTHLPLLPQFLWALTPTEVLPLLKRRL